MSKHVVTEMRKIIKNWNNFFF